MKKVIWMTLFIVTFCALSIEPASALTNSVVKVGLRYGSSAMAPVMNSAITTTAGSL